MLPPVHPPVSNKDFDPATASIDEDVEMQTEEGETRAELSSVEINILIYLYLLESNFTHTAFSLLSESNLAQTSLFQHYHPSFPSPSGPNTAKHKANGASGINKAPRDGHFGKADGRIPKGELIKKLWKGLRWEEVERHVAANGDPYKPSCPSPFHLLIPHVCPPGYPSANGNPDGPIQPSLRLPSESSPRPPQAFPPPSEAAPEAGPSKVRETKGRRRPQRMSAETTSRHPSPSASTASAREGLKDKGPKRATRTVEESDSGRPGPRSRKQKDKDVEDAMSFDDEPRKKSRQSNGRAYSPLSVTVIRDKQSGSSGLDSVEETDRRSRSPVVLKEEKEEEEEEEAEEEEENGVDEEAERKVELERRQTQSWWIKDTDVQLFFEHRDAVTSVAWNPGNNEVLATGSGDGTVKLWDMDNNEGQVKLAKKPYSISHKSIESNKKAVSAVAWHPDGTVLGTGSQDGTGRLFTPSGQLQGIMTYGRGAVTALKFAPSGTHIITAKTDFTVSLWSVSASNDQRMVRTFQTHTAEVNDVDWLDDTVFASCGNDRKIFVYGTNDKRSRFTFDGHTDDITRLKWQPAVAGVSVEDRMLASAGDDGTVRIWLLPKYPKDLGTVSRSLSPIKRGEEGLDRGVELYSSKNEDTQSKRRCIRVITVVDESENKRMDMIEWAPSGNIIAAAGQDTTVKLFDAVSGDCLHVLKGLEEGTGAIAFSPAAKGLIAGAGWNAHLLFWDVETGQVVAEYEFDEDPKKRKSRDKPMNRAVEWRDDGNQLAVGLGNKGLMLVRTEEVGKSKADEV